MSEKIIYKPIEQKEQPKDLETESVVLATMMRYNDVYESCADMLNADIFYNEKNRAIFRTISGVITEGKITDINTLYNYSKSNKVGFQLDRMDFVDIFQKSSPVTFKQDCMRLRDLSKRRKAWYQMQVAATKIFDFMEGSDKTINDLTTALSELQEDTENTGVCSFSDAIAELDNIVEDNRRGKSRFLRTGFYVFDNYFLLRPDTLTVIAAFTSVGKSALAMNIAHAVAKQGIGVAYYSLEMGKAELASRAISGVANVSSSDIMNTKLESYDYSQFKKAASIERELPIYIDERATVSFDRTIRSARTLVKTKNVKLVIIDYLQIYNQTGNNTEGALAEMARESKNASKELGIPFILLSQLNRSAEHPSRKMLRGSGQIEESADNVVLIDRPEAEPNSNIQYEGELKSKDTRNTAAFILAKGRGVGTCVKLVGFNPKFTQFYDIDDNYNPIGDTIPPKQEENLPF